MNKEEDENALMLNFETGEILRGEVVIMSLEELLFLLGAGIAYDTMCPIKQSVDFIAELREIIGVGFTPEQFEEIKAFYAKELVK